MFPSSAGVQQLRHTLLSCPSFMRSAITFTTLQTVALTALTFGIVRHWRDGPWTAMGDLDRRVECGRKNWNIITWKKISCLILKSGGDSQSYLCYSLFLCWAGRECHLPDWPDKACNCISHCAIVFIYNAEQNQFSSSSDLRAPDSACLLTNLAGVNVFCLRFCSWSTFTCEF